MVDDANMQGNTALHIACNLSHLDIVSLLLEAKADPCASSGGGKTCVPWVGTRHSFGKLLSVAEGAACMGDSNGMSPDPYTSLLGHYNIINFILSRTPQADRGALLATASREKRTALHFASHAGHCNLVRQLLDARTDATARESFGRSALIVAIKRKQVGLVALLSSRNCGLDLEDNDGMQPLHTLSNLI
jgi:ankyrin repeat protein